MNGADANTNMKTTGVQLSQPTAPKISLLYEACIQTSRTSDDLRQILDDINNEDRGQPMEQPTIISSSIRSVLEDGPRFLEQERGKCSELISELRSILLG